MDSSILGLILDSSIVIEAERQRLDVARFLKYVASLVGEQHVALSVVTVAELAHGIYRAGSLERQQFRRDFLDDLKATVPIYPITLRRFAYWGLRFGAPVCRRHAERSALRKDSWP